MSTRAHIVKKLENGKYIGIYHHSDGYPSWLGKLLAEHYTDEEQLDKLLALGDLSCAGSLPEDDPNLWKFGLSGDSNKCRTYRGRGDTGVDAKHGKLLDFLTENYTYVFENGKWTVYEYDTCLGELTEVLRNN